MCDCQLPSAKVSNSGAKLLSRDEIELERLIQNVARCRPPLRENQQLTGVFLSRQIDSNRSIVHKIVGNYRTAIWCYNSKYKSMSYTVAKHYEHKMRDFLETGVLEESS